MPIKRPLSKPAHLEQYRGKPELLKGKTYTEMKSMQLRPDYSIDQGKPGYPKPRPSQGAGVDRYSLLKPRGMKIPPVEPIPPNTPKKVTKRKPQGI